MASCHTLLRYVMLYYVLIDDGLICRLQELLPGKSRYAILSILLVGIVANYSISKSKKDAEEA